MLQLFSVGLNLPFVTAWDGSKLPRGYPLASESETGGVNVEAIIVTGGKQFRVAEGDTITVEKLPEEQGQEVVFERVLTIHKDGELMVGRPVVEGAKVVGKILGHGKDKKIIVFKYKAKKNYRRKQGHRQPLTRVLIEKIEV